eukprot:gnl/MRDRNA2_/MRDRNA2_69255_c0_seq1.p1 gnl/MRDRNA2_/MRDRNA2_69255_c0~~gnl/MRDRNA2_/MRDRNA2_69255_c0_seq1.p1  ORF type:complete len:266 (+),score=52.72 gnl/MRDRNA2_/MRDRNA2_69255_c0_seq1:37-834(+)
MMTFCEERPYEICISEEEFAKTRSLGITCQLREAATAWVPKVFVAQINEGCLSSKVTLGDEWVSWTYNDYMKQGEARETTLKGIEITNKLEVWTSMKTKMSDRVDMSKGMMLTFNTYSKMARLQEPYQYELLVSEEEFAKQGALGFICERREVQSDWTTKVFIAEISEGCLAGRVALLNEWVSWTFSLKGETKETILEGTEIVDQLRAWATKKTTLNEQVDVSKGQRLPIVPGCFKCPSQGMENSHHCQGQRAQDLGEKEISQSF